MGMEENPKPAPYFKDDLSEKQTDVQSEDCNMFNLSFAPVSFPRTDLFDIPRNGELYASLSERMSV